jgi:[ribosomal protein S18]-alanine N-acetyltransferase
MPANRAAGDADIEPVIRPGQPADLPAVAAIQRGSPEAAQWDVASYLDREFLVAVVENSVAGFIVCRTVARGEREILNLAVAPGFRRRGAARALLAASLAGFEGAVFLEVRESNAPAQTFYKSMGFHVVNCRKNYYDLPPEAAIVMKFHSC